VTFETGTGGADQPPPDIESDLVDLSGLLIDDLDGCDQQVLAPALRRMMARIDDGQGNISGYNPANPG
jgi:hypothetical protein